ncbi:MAG: hypothetical protein ACK4NC_02700 [Candidatus Gracilibacteria bacterium]
MKSRLLLVPLLLITLAGCSSQAEKIQGDLMQKKDELSNSAASSIEKIQTKAKQGKEALDSVQNAAKKVDEFSK